MNTIHKMLFSIALSATMLAQAILEVPQNPAPATPKKPVRSLSKQTVVRPQSVDLNTLIDIADNITDTVLNVLQEGLHRNFVKAIRQRDVLLKRLNPVQKPTEFFTIFAPLDDAVALAKATIKPEDLDNYIVRGIHRLEDTESLTTIGGKKLTITKKHGIFQVNGVEVIDTDQGKNGIVYAIDGVLK